MDKVLTIDDWWDGPVLGLAEFNNSTCVFVRRQKKDYSNDTAKRGLDVDKSEYSDTYLLTPVNDDEKKEILKQWGKWCHALKAYNLEDFYIEVGSDSLHSFINSIAHRIQERTCFVKSGVFSGKIGRGWIPEDYYVEWSDIPCTEHEINAEKNCP